MATVENKIFGGPIKYDVAKKITEQMQKNIFRIKLYNDKDNKMSKGFFCKIPDKIKKNLSKVLITTKEIINEVFLKEENKDIIIYTKQEPKRMNLNNRNIYEYKDIFSLIEIKEEDGIKEFFDIETIDTNDQDIGKYYNNKNIYMIQNQNEDLFLSFGLFENIDKNENNSFYHTCPTITGSSGSPILNLENYKIIGIHMPNNSKKNRGIFFNFFNETKQIQIFDKQKTNEVAYESKSRKRSVINLKFKFINGTDLSHKKGFKNFNLPESSRLNSIIQMLTSMKEIYDFIDSNIGGDNKKDKFNNFSHIYVLTSFLSKAHKEIYQIEKSENPSLKEMNTIIKFLSQDKTIKSTYDYFLFILNELHEELISYKDNFPRSEKLISFESPFNDLENSKNTFFHYYKQQYSKSIISDLFNWILRKNKTCNHCKNISYSFQAFPLISFNLDLMTENNEGNGNIDLPTCFDIYFSYNKANNDCKEKCNKCSKDSGFSLTYTLEQYPKYFIIVINKEKPNTKLLYSEELELSLKKDNQCLIKKYKLISIIFKDCKSTNNYYYVVKNKEEEKEGSIFEEWISFKDEKVHISEFDKIINFERFEEVYNPLNVKILLYKDITGN